MSQWSHFFVSIDHNRRMSQRKKIGGAAAEETKIDCRADACPRARRCDAEPYDLGPRNRLVFSVLASSDFMKFLRPFKPTMLVIYSNHKVTKPIPKWERVRGSSRGHTIFCHTVNKVPKSKIVFYHLSNYPTCRYLVDYITQSYIKCVFVQY